MSLSVNYSSSSSRGLLALNANDRLMALINERLSSGLRINRSFDDPNGLVEANRLRQRSIGVEHATANSEQGVSLLQTAEGSMQEMSNILIRLRELALAAANSGTQDSSQLAALQADFNAGIGSIDRIAKTASFGKKPLLQGIFAGNTLSEAARKFYDDVALDATKIPGGIEADSTMTIGAPSADLTRESITATFDTGGPGIPLSTDLISGLYQGTDQLTISGSTTLAVTGPMGFANIVVDAANTVGDLVGLFNATTEKTGLRATYDDTTGAFTVESTHFGSGALNIVGSDLTGGSDVGLLDTDTTNDYSLTDLEPARDTFLMTLESAVTVPALASDPILNLIGNGTTFDDVDGKTLTIFGKGTSASLTLSDTTTVQDVVDWVNGVADQIGALASFDATTGNLQIVGTAGSIMVSCEDLTTALSGWGLLDRDTADIDSAGAAQNATAANATLPFTFIDAGGTSRTVTLTQDPLSEGGLTFTNLTPGPELVPPFSGWEVGAIRITFKDTSDGEIGSMVFTPTDPYTATRQSNRFIQTGGLTGEHARIEIRDLRAAALGLTAFQAELASTAADKPLVEKGYHSLLDLLDNDVLMAGDARDALKIIDAAIEEVSSTRAKVGSIQQFHIESSLDALRVVAENLTSAESQIRDVDFALASSDFARLNILMQSSMAMLAQANQVPQRVLQMLAGGQ